MIVAASKTQAVDYEEVDVDVDRDGDAGDY
jgi:hypothetical protein